MTVLRGRMASSMEDPIAEQFAVFADYVREKGLRMTRQRELVVKTFLRSEGHLSTDELYELVREKDAKIGYATVFRTLKALTDCGLARETDLDDGRTRFEQLYRRPEHHHIVCIQCNRTIEFFNPELERLQDQIVAEYDFKPLRSRFQIFGLCRACRGDQAPAGRVYDADLVFARDALRIAMETERRGVRFYQTASEIVAHDSTRQTFLLMLKDEEKHLRNLQQEWDRLIRENRAILDAPVFLHFDFESLRKIFPSREEIGRRLRRDMSELEALELAMSMEKDAWDFFRNYADKFTDTRGRDIFLQFAEEERDHYETIRATWEQVQQRQTQLQ